MELKTSISQSAIARRTIVAKYTPRDSRRHVISEHPAVLENFGMPWVFGYKPVHNYQTIIIDTIERHLIGSMTPTEQVPTS
jgi:hypothetical protein